MITKFRSKCYSYDQIIEIAEKDLEEIVEASAACVFQWISEEASIIDSKRIIMEITKKNP